MHLQMIKNVMSARGLSRAEVARLAGVSRAAVSRWFRQGKKTGWINVETRTIFNLAASLGLPPETFLRERTDLSIYQAEFLWDMLYPDMESFLKAVVEGHPPALARLVQVLGFHEAMAVAGKKVITSFRSYKRFIHPSRRNALEALWPLYKV